MSWRDAVCKDVETWLGTPYVPMGRVKKVGVDCGGLLYQVYQPYFGPFAPFPFYAPDWSQHRDNELYLDFIKPYTYEITEPIKGGVGLFKMGQAFAHAALYMGDGTFIHAWGRKGSGSVTRTPLRVMRGLCKIHKPKFFDLVERL